MRDRNCRKAQLSLLICGSSESNFFFFGVEDHCVRISNNIKIIFVITRLIIRKKYKSQNQTKKWGWNSQSTTFHIIKTFVKMKTLCYRFDQSILQLPEGRNCKTTASPVIYLASKSLFRTRKVDYSSAPFILKMKDLTLYTTFSLTVYSFTHLIQRRTLSQFKISKNIEHIFKELCTEKAFFFAELDIKIFVMKFLKNSQRS